jgi:hypothetical protein
VVSNNNAAKIYSNGILVYTNSSITYPSGPTMNPTFLYGINTAKRCFGGHIDDTRIFNTDALALPDIGALSHSLNDDSRLKLRMQLKDATDTLGKYNGTA